MLKDVAPNARAAAVKRARALRRAMSLPEVLLWRELRGSPQGVKFRRQHPSDSASLDFYCSDARLTVEIDGIAHDMGERPERDVVRDARFASAGVETLRIAAAEVLQDPADIVDRIIRHAVARLPLHHPAAPGGPPPRGKLGEDC